MKKNIDRERVVDLCARGFSRTYISRLLHVRNATLEKFCADNGIALNRKGTHSVGKKICGKISTRFGILRFDNCFELYYILYWECNADVVDITNNPKAVIDGKKVLRPNFGVLLRRDDEEIMQLVEISENFVKRFSKYDGMDYIVLYPNEKMYVMPDRIMELSSCGRIIFDNLYYNKKYGVTIDRL